jgi:hypothetical protein
MLPAACAVRASPTSGSCTGAGQATVQSSAQQRSALRPLPQAHIGLASIGDCEVIVDT